MNNRRSFLKSLSASGIFACLPTIEIRQGISMDLMQRFCWQYETQRFAMQHPFVESGNASATDAHAAIRVFDSMRLADTSSALKIPPLEKAFSQLWSPVASWQDLPRANYQPDPKTDFGCYHCNGHGFLGILRDCEDCYNTGNQLDFWDTSGEPITKPCESCCEGYLSDIRCNVCNGKPYGKGLGGVMRLTEELKINASYHHLLSMLPGARWSVSKGYDDSVSGRKGPVCLVEFEGGQAMVMGIRSK